eukprot:scaffold4126_cov383-Prasinococcus_capsulatus_cf.AAC.1
MSVQAFTPPTAPESMPRCSPRRSRSRIPLDWSRYPWRLGSTATVLLRRAVWPGRAHPTSVRRTGRLRRSESAARCGWRPHRVAEAMETCRVSQRCPRLGRNKASCHEQPASRSSPGSSTPCGKSSPSHRGAGRAGVYVGRAQGPRALRHPPRVRRRRAQDFVPGHAHVHTPASCGPPAAALAGAADARTRPR